MLDTQYIKSVFVGPNPDDLKIFMVDYDNIGYRGGTDTFKSTIKLDKDQDTDDLFVSFLEMLYDFDFSDYPSVFKREHLSTNKRSFYQLLKSGFDYLTLNAQIGPPNFIIINEKYFENPLIKKLVYDSVDTIIHKDIEDIIIGRKNTNINIEPGLYLYHNAMNKYSVDVVGNRAKNQYLVLKIK